MLFLSEIVLARLNQNYFLFQIQMSDIGASSSLSFRDLFIIHVLVKLLPTSMLYYFLFDQIEIIDKLMKKFHEMLCKIKHSMIQLIVFDQSINL